jgi:Xaa-Pro dipeptidase
MSKPQTDSAIPGIIYAEIAKHLLPLPKTSEAWTELHKAHVERLKSAWGAALSRLGLDGVVIHNGVSAKRYSRDDQYWPQAITPHFAHWTPYRETAALLVITPGNKPRLISEAHTSFWEGPAPAIDTWSRASFALEEAASLDKQQGLSAFAFIGDDVGLAMALGIAPEQRNRDDLFAIVDQFRTLKSDFEVCSMRVATATAARGHVKLRDLFLAGDHSELSLHHAYLQETAQTDYDLPYGSIVAQGSNCGILHHVHYDRVVRRDGLSLLVDAGAQCHGYASDITRTWSRGQGAAATVFAGLIDALDDVQQRLVAGFEVGKPYEDLHNKSHTMIGQVLKDSDLVRASAEDMVQSGLTRLFFPHGLGHSLGLQVHDVGMRLKQPAANNPYLRNTSAIAAGQVTTIEPGIYFIPNLMQQALSGPMGTSVNRKLLDSLMPFGGIRIEDNILATESGPVNLTRDALRC